MKPEDLVLLDGMSTSLADSTPFGDIACVGLAMLIFAWLASVLMR